MSAKYVNQLPCRENCGSSQNKSDEATPLLVSDISSRSYVNKKSDPTSVETLRKLFEYDPVIGCLRWLKPPVPALLGQRPGYVGNNGYQYIDQIVDGTRLRSLEHRAIWAFVHGVWPTEIDHINGNKRDNRLENLREVTRTENSRNHARCARNTSGVTGVYWHKAAGKWASRIMVNYKNKHLGLFDNFEDAVAARKAAEVKYGFHPNHGRD